MTTDAERPAAAMIDWVMTEGREIQDTPALMDAFCRRLLAMEAPVWRVNWQILMLHPQLRGMALIWHCDRSDVLVLERPHGSENTADYRESPLRAVIEDGVEGLRHRLEHLEPPWPYHILGELKAAGATDYVAMPVRFSGGRRTCATFATRRPGGFTVADLALFDGALPALGLLLEKLELSRLAASLLDIYVGRHAGTRILSGDIRRGTNASLRAVLWYCDLRGFTSLADRLPREEIVALLNSYFEVMGSTVQSHGGEILKFIGDAMLAIFPLGYGKPEPVVDRAAVRLALAAALAAIEGLAALNAERAAWGQPTMQCGIALHLGDVMYGNIGASDRLDFTVIGRAVNLVTRMEGLCKRLDRLLVTSADFAQNCDTPLISCGFQPLRGLRDPVEVFTVDGM
jgi:adenylate cyclase